ncbi:MAG: hypothetical protein AAB897_04170 [Patescibacteria group bacterium]
MFPKKLFIILLVIIIAIVAVGVWLGFKFFGTPDPAGPSPYSAVYLVSGDIYFGKLSWFPRPLLRDVWFLQRGVDPQTQQPQFGLNKFTTAFWGPVDEMRLNPDQILFSTRLRNDSQVAQAFANPQVQEQVGGGLGSPQQSVGGPPPTTPTGAPSPAFEGPTGPPPSGGQ